MSLLGSALWLLQQCTAPGLLLSMGMMMPQEKKINVFNYHHCKLGYWKPLIAYEITPQPGLDNWFTLLSLQMSGMGETPFLH